MKQSSITVVEGKVIESLPNTLFKVELDGGRVIIVSVAGKLRRSFLRMYPGDRVRVEMTPYDEDRGRVVFRYR